MEGSHLLRHEISVPATRSPMGSSCREATVSAHCEQDFESRPPPRQPFHRSTALPPRQNSPQCFQYLCAVVILLPSNTFPRSRYFSTLKIEATRSSET
jgi:hypothetical protein